MTATPEQSAELRAFFGAALEHFENPDTSAIDAMLHRMHEFTRLPGEAVMRCACGAERVPWREELRCWRVA